MQPGAETAERIARMMELAFPGEAQRRIYLALEAKPLGRGGVAAVAEAAGVSEGTVRAGLRDLEDPEALRETLGQGRSRRPGGGRRAATEEHPSLEQLVLSLVDEATHGDPGRDVAYTTKSVRNVAEQASAVPGAQEGREVAVSHETVRGVLAGNGYSTRGNTCVPRPSPFSFAVLSVLHIAISTATRTSHASTSHLSPKRPKHQAGNTLSGTSQTLFSFWLRHSPQHLRVSSFAQVKPQAHRRSIHRING